MTFYQFINDTIFNQKTLKILHNYFFYIPLNIDI